MAPVQLTDIYPTLVELTGGKLPNAIDGVSAKTALEDGEPKRKAMYASAGYGEIDSAKLKAGTGQDALHTRVFDLEMQETHRTAMIRVGEWKLILNETRGPELHHLPGRSHETANVAESPTHAAVRRDLVKKLGEWWAW